MTELTKGPTVIPVDEDGENVELWSGICESLEHHWGDDASRFYTPSLKWEWFVNEEPLAVVQLCDLDDPDDNYCVLGGDLPPSEWPMKNVETRFPLKRDIRFVMYQDDSMHPHGGQCCALLENETVLARFFLYSIQEQFLDSGSLDMPIGSRDSPYEEEDGHMGYQMWLFREGDMVYVATVGDGSENLTTYFRVPFEEYRAAWKAFAGEEHVVPRAKKGRFDN
jgi:hypothetical protein